MQWYLKMLKKGLDMLKWAVEQNGYSISEKLELKDLRSVHPSLGIGFVAAQDIKEDEELVTFRKENVLCFTNSELSKISEVVDLPGWAALLLTMAYENSKSDSFWRPYLDVFPNRDRITSPFFWEEEKKKKLLSGTVLESNRDYEEIDHLWKDSIEPIKEKYPDLLSNVRFDDYARMAAVMLAYSFDTKKTASKEESAVEEEGDESKDIPHEASTSKEVKSAKGSSFLEQEGNRKAEQEEDRNSEAEDSDVESEYDPEEFEKSMCPVADMFNGDDELCNIRLYDLDGRLTMIACRDIKQGEQVWNTYGEIDNSELFRKYGFTKPEGTPYDFVLIKGEDWLSEYVKKIGQEEVDERLELLLYKEVLSNIEGDFTFSAGDLDFTGICLSFATMEKKEKTTQVPKKSEIQPKHCRKLLKIIENRLRMYPELEDPKTLDEKNAIVLIEKEKNLLQNLYDNVKDSLAKKTPSKRQKTED
ncbi:lysine methyltransferase [Schizosaccharomyces cryophilus OY26]|uniref:Ribosomal lysine N-methyltransferase 4 n=1 Tax=Schizosaccharomyces cryophilus (strain OY26 / ATCC MYA-4695 / CBS 11777 / NBRC 106824 / NRRL Y48691) TaxID=653667 RepID=S9W4E4_SCHCR|nr:lysine methyltransferase [Schizosaccharomyces cryophilus OY26]EPY53379.1 lysine methyltransferase [Schizosaccharomyces cryophilus OY26]